MEASCANWIAVGSILAAGLAVFGSTGAAAGLRPPVSPPPAVSIWRGGDHRAIEDVRRRAARDHRNQLDLFGAVGPTEGETPAAQEEEAPQADVSCPPASALGRVAAQSAGPRIIEIGGHASAARRGPLPVVIYGDLSR
jgi:hypothetical protein